MYEHFKGKMYRVTGIALHTVSLEPVVEYYPLGKPNERWVRPLNEFQEAVEVNGQIVPRYQLITRITANPLF